MIEHRRLQRRFADGLIAEEVQDLWEPWMRQADAVLDDETLLNLVQQELSRRIKKSQTRGRPGTTAEVVLRMLVLKHMRSWSFAELTREGRISVLKRRHGLDRCRYRGAVGMQRWVGLGVIADTLTNLGRALATRPEPG